MFNSEFDNHQS